MGNSPRQGAAPGGPEVEQDGLVLQAGGGDGGAVERGEWDGVELDVFGAEVDVAAEQEEPGGGEEEDGG